MAPDFYLSKGMSELFRVAFCNSCQLGFSYPKMDYQELSRYYPNEYIPYQPRLGLKGWLRKVKFGTDYKIMRRSCEAVKDCFEVGAGSGRISIVFKNAGLSVAGLEQSIEGCRVAAQIFEIDLKNSNAEGYLFSQTYDCVIARYVLEHLNAPIEVLSNIYTDGLSAKEFCFEVTPLRFVGKRGLVKSLAWDRFAPA
ncbi:MAG: methyltransferase domain-containing protein [Bdellovibrionales bacterium]|nr:methyltransferase domain-containing protein [Bdellovibrionales bacterium]